MEEETVTLSLVLDGWLTYVLTGAGFLLLLVVSFSAVTAYNKWRERQAVDRIERFLKQRFG